LAGKDNKYSRRARDYDPLKNTKIRILSSRTLPVNFSSRVIESSQDRKTGGCFCFTAKKTKWEPEQFNEIIFHIHGGGFVSMSSATHQNYTRQWANNLDVPVFSVDHRLAPEYPFPAAVNDCWQAYVWTVNHAKE